MDEIRYCYRVINLRWLRILGQIIGLGVPPVHTQIFYRINDQCYMTELTSDPVPPQGEIVGRGDGYTIQITKVPYVLGEPVEGDCSTIDAAARAYASTKNGYLAGTFSSHEWYAIPQGYGGPYYDRCTSNTYASWILKKCCKKMPPKPSGAIGWDSIPFFPGP